MKLSREKLLPGSHNDEYQLLDELALEWYRTNREKTFNDETGATDAGWEISLYILHRVHAMREAIGNGEASDYSDAYLLACGHFVQFMQMHGRPWLVTMNSSSQLVIATARDQREGHYWPMKDEHEGTAADFRACMDAVIERVIRHGPRPTEEPDFRIPTLDDVMVPRALSN